VTHSIAPLLLFSFSLFKSQMGRTPCCLKQHIFKGAWSKEEDQLLINYVNCHGEGNWRCLPKAAGIFYKNHVKEFLFGCSMITITIEAKAITCISLK